MLNNVNLKDGCIITQSFTAQTFTCDHLTSVHLEKNTQGFTRDHLTSYGLEKNTQGFTRDHLTSYRLEKILRASLAITSLLVALKKNTQGFT